MISALRHRVILCSQKDVVSEGAELRLVRNGVVVTWAMIEPKKGSSFSPTGMAVKDSRNMRTHQITMRYRPDLVITLYAWLYEERLVSPPRWFKVLSVSETETGGAPMYMFDVCLVERGDDATRPAEAGPATVLPFGVVL